jgi:SET domain-containing protein
MMHAKTRAPFFEVRDSPIQGLGAFALRQIRKGTRIIEYQGERITPEEADRRYDDDQSEHPHVLLFTVNKKTIIDAGIDGNEAKYINHSCEPNCQAVIEDRRVYIEASRTILPGEELTYDYQLERDGLDPESERRYTCRCGARTCRGTMLAPNPKSRNKRNRGKPAK